MNICLLNQQLGESLFGVLKHNLHTQITFVFYLLIIVYINAGHRNSSRLIAAYIHKWRPQIYPHEKYGVFPRKPLPEVAAVSIECQSRIPNASARCCIPHLNQLFTFTEN